MNHARTNEKKAETRHVHCKIAEDSIRSDTGYPISFLKIHIYRDIQYLRVPDI